jgi:hypothetical protein
MQWPSEMAVGFGLVFVWLVGLIRIVWTWRR